MIQAFFAGILLSLASSIHCIGMCGPLALAFKMNFKQDSHWPIVQYHFGRLFAYLTLGLVALFFGRSIQIFISSQKLSIIIGVVILFILALSFGVRKLQFEIKYLKQLRTTLMAKTHPFLVGIGNGLIPCGLVYAALGMSLAFSSEFGSLFFMLGFGLGTFPATGIVQILGKKINLRKYLKPQISQWVIGVMAVLFIIRGLNLNIPYLSPQIVEEGTNKTEVNCCTGNEVEE